MRHLNKPNDDVETVFLSCVAAVSNSDLKNRLQSCKDVVIAEARNYELQIKANTLHSITINKASKANKALRVVNGQVTIDEMKDVYSKYFVPPLSPGRDLYERLLALPKNKKCPYCFHRRVSTIDHYLPKAYYPLLSVVPVNLVASCKDCNMGSKRVERPLKPTDEVLQ